VSFPTFPRTGLPGAEQAYAAGWSAMAADTESSRLVRALAALIEARDRQAIAEVVCPAARDLVHADGAALLLPEGDGCRAWGEDSIAPLWRGPPRERFGAWALEQDRPVTIEEASVDLDDYRDSFVGGLTLVPVRRGKTRGALSCLWAGPGAASREQLPALEALARATGAALESAAEREQLADRARAGDAVREDARTFLGALTHGVRTPLAQVMGFAQLLSDERARLGAGLADFVEQILAAARHGNTVVDELTRMARVLQVDLQACVLDVAELASEVSAALTRRFPGRHIRWDIAGPLPARGDPRLVRTLLEQLLANAVKATARQDPAHIQVGARDGAFFVRDDGIGFDPGRGDRIFTPFGRMHPSEEWEGVGLGLATGRRIVERHGGRLWAESAPGRGATFFFSLGP
jgi:signal transduction histidine kinase